MISRFGKFQVKDKRRGRNPATNKDLYRPEGGYIQVDGRVRSCFNALFSIQGRSIFSRGHPLILKFRPKLIFNSVPLDTQKGH